jgi:hypothetical protein
MLGELKIPAAARLIGIDVGLFFQAFGQDWTEMLWDKLRDDKAFTFYWYVAEEPDEAMSGFLASVAGMPVFSGFSAPRSIALIAKSAGIVSGKSIFFELANMMRKPVVGIFEENERAVYCQGSATTKSVTFSVAPDSGAIEKIVAFVKSLDTVRRA